MGEYPCPKCGGAFTLRQDNSRGVTFQGLSLFSGSSSSIS